MATLIKSRQSDQSDQWRNQSAEIRPGGAPCAVCKKTNKKRKNERLLPRGLNRAGVRNPDGCKDVKYIHSRNVCRKRYSSRSNALHFNKRQKKQQVGEKRDYFPLVTKKTLIFVCSLIFCFSFEANVANTSITSLDTSF